MTEWRLETHPILEIPARETIPLPGAAGICRRWQVIQLPRLSLPMACTFLVTTLKTAHLRAFFAPMASAPSAWLWLMAGPSRPV